MLSPWSRLPVKLTVLGANNDMFTNYTYTYFQANKYGHSLIDFLINSNFCILNGRNSVKNDFTSVSTKGSWMDGLGFYVPSTVFQSFRDDGTMNMKGSVQ